MAVQPTISRFFKSSKGDGPSKAAKSVGLASSRNGENGQVGKTPETSICLTDSEEEVDLNMDCITTDICNVENSEEIAKEDSSINETVHQPNSHMPHAVLSQFALKQIENANDDNNDHITTGKENNNILKRKPNEIAIPCSKISVVKTETESYLETQPVKKIKKSNNGDKVNMQKDTTNAKKNKLTPLDEQVQSLKLKHLDKLLVIRVGYKYKCFAEDAVIASNILHIKLIPGKLHIDESHPGDKEHKQFAYCSFPDIRLNINLERLIHHNLKVAVVEQAETTAIKKQSSNKSSVFERKITNVFSKATYGINISNTTNKKDSPVLGDGNSIWVLQISDNPDKRIYNYHLLSVNLNSGDIVYDEFSDVTRSNDKLFTRMKYLEPIEVLVKNMEALPINVSKIFKQNDCRLIEFKDFEKIGEISNKFSVFNLPKYAIPLICIMFQYLKEYNNADILLIESNYKPFTSKIFMPLDGNTIDALDIFSNEGKKGSLLWILDHTRTPFGLRELKNWIKNPLINKIDIENRFDAVECISKEVQCIFFESLNQMLKSMPDLAHTLNRVMYGRTSRKEVYYFLKQVCTLSDQFHLHEKYIQTEIISKNGKINQKSSLLSTWFRDIFEYFQTVNLSKLLSMININTINERDTEKQIIEFFNLNNYMESEKMIQIQREIQSIKDDLGEELKQIRKFLNRPHLTFKNEVEFLIEVRNTQIKGIPDDWIKINNTKMVSRFLTPTCSKLVNKIMFQKELLLQEAELQYSKFLGMIKDEYPSLQSMIKKLANYDCILSLATTSCLTNYSRPKFSDSDEQFINIKAGRNAIIESLDKHYVPNDVNMSTSNGRISIITGPNMGGKSSYIRQVALLIVMAQIGCFVPAESMESTIFDNILTRIGAYDNLLQGQSTFMIEMTEILNIIKKSTPKSLLLLDEVGRGTGTVDGKAISFALLKYFIDMERECPLVLFTTHFLMIGEQLKNHHKSALKNYYMDYVEEKKPDEDWLSVTFLYTLKPGLSKDSFGLNVAKLAHIDKSLINRAHELSSKMKADEQDSEKALQFIVDLKNTFAVDVSTMREKLSFFIDTVIEDTS